jgi:hypothetical protein
MEDDDLFETWPRKSARIRNRQAARAAQEAANAEQKAARASEAAQARRVKEEKEQHEQWSQQRDAQASQIQKSNRVKAVKAARGKHGKRGKSATPSSSFTLSPMSSSIAKSSSPPQLLSDPKDEDGNAEDGDITAVGSLASTTPSLNPSSPPSSGTDSAEDENLRSEDGDHDLASDSEIDENTEEDDEDGERLITKTSNRRLPSVPAPSCSNSGARTRPRGAVSGKTLPGTRDAMIANSKTARRDLQRRNAKLRPTRPRPCSRSHYHDSHEGGEDDDGDEEEREEEEDEGSSPSSVFDCGELLDKLLSESSSYEYSDDEVHLFTMHLSKNLHCKQQQRKAFINKNHLIIACFFVRLLFFIKIPSDADTLDRQRIRAKAAGTMP